jgi:hypothetical protein
MDAGGCRMLSDHLLEAFPHRNDTDDHGDGCCGFTILGASLQNDQVRFD